MMVIVSIGDDVDVDLSPALCNRLFCLNMTTVAGSRQVLQWHSLKSDFVIIDFVLKS